MCHATGLTVAHLLGHESTQILPTYVRPLDENTRALIEASECGSQETARGPALYQLSNPHSFSLSRNVADFNLGAQKGMKFRCTFITFLSQQDNLEA